jgi:hypothetical protein
MDKKGRLFSARGAPARLRAEVLKEYYFIEGMIDSYDDRCLKIKSWSITASAVAIAFGFSENRPALFALASFGSLAFWYLEGLWKIYQGIMVVRLQSLETLLAAPDLIYTGPKIAATFRESFADKIETKLILRKMWYRNVWIPHFFIILLGAALSIGSLLHR